MDAQQTINILQEKLSASQQNSVRLQCIFKAIPDAVAFADLKRRFVMINSAFTKAIGYQEEELLGQSVEMIYASRAEFERQGKIRFQRDCQEKLLPYEVNYRRKDGSLFPGETTCAPIRDENGQTYGFIGLIRDISKRQEAEDSLRELELMYRTVANFTYDWEIWANLDSTLRYVSPSCERISGYPAEEFIANPDLFREIILADDIKTWEDHYHDARQEYQLREIQFRIRKKDGSLAWIEHACQPVNGAQGEILGFRSSNRDITRRKNAEEDLHWALAEINRYQDKLEEESACLRKEINLVCNYKHIIGSSKAISSVLLQVEQIAPTDTTVIIFGETGTGKELLARAIHEQSLRKERPMLTVNCAALPLNLIESELFGHEKGAFTGAHSRKKGRFEIAAGATLFLDEIGELSLEAQAKLLRILQTGELERLGSARTIKVDVRIIAATNRNLEEDVRQGIFRQDLWYRLNVFPITAPPLRERLSDLPQLLEYFIDKFSRKQGKTITTIGLKVLEALRHYSWPGNIRELENVIERAMITSSGSNLVLADALTPARADIQGLGQRKSLAAMERDYILKVLGECGWKISGRDSAAEILDLKRSTLRAKMARLHIRKP
ncbi:MAG: sigma 54-interacting transcriptional regulator [Thermodesulfobacteriota bacterium]